MRQYPLKSFDTWIYYLSIDIISAFGLMIIGIYSEKDNPNILYILLNGDDSAFNDFENYIDKEPFLSEFFCRN